MSNDCHRKLELLRQTLMARMPEEVPPRDICFEPELLTFHAELLELRRFILAVSQGDLNQPLNLKGHTAGALKNLQANLRHLTWQTRMIASGDFSQRLDFLGDLSDAFNMMVDQLAQAINIIREKEEELAAYNTALLQEIRAKEEAQAALVASEEHYRTLTESMKDVVWVLDSDSLRFIYVSPSVRALRGFSPEEVIGQHVNDTLTEQSAAMLRERILEQRELFLHCRIPEKTFFTAEIEERCKNGGTVWTEAIMRYRVHPETGGIDIHGTSRDITERRTLRLQLERQATSDDLTGVFNRRFFLSCAEQEVRKSARSGHPLSIIMIDLDHFKKVNDTFGHATGDRALKEIALACNRTLREFDKIGRLGGEEFALLLVNTDLEHGEQVAERIRQEISDLQVLSDRNEPIPLRVSAGVTALSHRKDTLSDMLARADQALYRAKASGRNRVERG